MELNDEMKGLLKDLGMALHQALTKDTQIKSITDRIKGSGYDIYLIMEANIALDRRDNDTDGRLFLRRPEEQAEIDDLSFNDYDEEFLSSLKIQVDGNP
ncbi:MAG: hypothetical protein QNK37_01080 [Acidobacteriota bacterium]|nr:hypothetical protein [Acidobacteriota bacterium]